MLSLLLVGWMELITGAKIICSEANTLDYPAKVAVGASIKNQAKGFDKTPLETMNRRRAYAKNICSDDMLKLEHFKAYIDGMNDKGPDWTRDVHSFYHIKLDGKLFDTWTRRGLRKIKTRGKVVYFAHVKQLKEKLEKVKMEET